MSKHKGEKEINSKPHKKAKDINAKKKHYEFRKARKNKHNMWGGQ